MFEILMPHHDYGYQLIWFGFSLFMTYLSYYMAIVEPPGSPSPEFKPRKGEWRRWCLKCNAYKPERAHHCRQCKKCVLRMDHHCMLFFFPIVLFFKGIFVLILSLVLTKAPGLVTALDSIICLTLSDF